ncbi:hypothetical protein [Pseudoalteromonas sp. SWN166]|nr:hypothetical protein [Pseudoalteromonas sp. SWN166]
MSVHGFGGAEEFVAALQGFMFVDAAKVHINLTSGQVIKNIG